MQITVAHTKTIPCTIDTDQWRTCVVDSKGRVFDLFWISEVSESQGNRAICQQELTAAKKMIGKSYNMICLPPNPVDGIYWPSQAIEITNPTQGTLF